MSAASRTKRIAELNDQLRARIQMPVFGKAFPPGAAYISGALADLGPEAQILACAAVRNFSDFTAENDPYGEHDFGAISLPNIGKIFWKIDYYADENCEYGSEDPSDPELSYRVLTLMLAEDY